MLWVYFWARYRVCAQVLLIFPVLIRLTIILAQLAAGLAPPAFDNEFLILFLVANTGDRASILFNINFGYAVLVPLEVRKVEFLDPHIVGLRYPVVARYAGQLGYIGDAANPYFPLLFEVLGHHEELVAVGVTKWFALVQVKHVLVFRDITCDVPSDSSTFLGLAFVTVDEMSRIYRPYRAIWVLFPSSNREGTKQFWVVAALEAILHVMMILPISLLIFQIFFVLLLFLGLIQLVVESWLEILLVSILIKHQILISVLFRVLLVAQERIYSLHLVNNQNLN